MGSLSFSDLGNRKGGHKGVDNGDTPAKESPRHLRQGPVSGGLKFQLTSILFFQVFRQCSSPGDSHQQGGQLRLVVHGYKHIADGPKLLMGLLLKPVEN